MERIETLKIYVYSGYCLHERMVGKKIKEGGINIKERRGDKSREEEIEGEERR